MQPAGSELPQLHHGMLRIPQGGGILRGHYHAAVCTADCQSESQPQPCRCVQQTEVKLLPDFLQHPPKVLLCHSRPPHSHRRRQQIEIGNTGMRHHSRFQRAAVQRHIGEIHQRPVRQTQGQIQISQSDVAVHAQHPLAALGQRGADSGSQGGLTGAALAGHYRDTLSAHDTTSLSNASILIITDSF